MKRYFNIKNFVVIFVIVFAVAIFNMHTFTKLSHSLNTTRAVLYDLNSNLGDGQNATPVITVNATEYMYQGRKVNSNSNYMNKVDRIQYQLSLKSVDDNNKLNYAVYKKGSTTALTDKFNKVVYKNGGKVYLALDIRDKNGLTVGDYNVVIWYDNLYNETKKPTSFSLKGNYYTASNPHYELNWGTGGTKEQSGWNVYFDYVDYINTDYFSIESITFKSGNEDVSANDSFQIGSRWGGWGYNNAGFQLVSVPSNDWEKKLRATTYTITIKYSNPGYSDIFGDLKYTINITLTGDSFKFDPVPTESHSYRLTRYPANYVLSRYYNNNVYINEAGVDKTIPVGKFKTDYTGIDINNEKFDSEGYYLYTLVDDAENTFYIQSLTTDEDEIEYVNYYDTDMVLHTEARTDFESVHGVLNTNMYTFEDGHVQRIVDGSFREFDNVDRTIRSAGGGKFIITYSYDTLVQKDFEDANITIRHHKVQDNENSTTFDVYKKRVNYYWWWGWHREENEEYPEGNVFAFNWSVDTTRKTVTMEVVYDSTDDKYYGGYDINIEFPDMAPVSVPFTIEDAPVDFFLATSVDSHESSTDPLPGLFPPGNKKYEYYFSLRMIKGEIDPYYSYNADALRTNIYSKRADLDEHNNIYFYDQVDYTIIIDKYNASTRQVTYRYSEDEAEYYTDKNYVTRTETLNGSSDFETKYTHAYNMLQYYIFDANGNINRSKDNIPNSILRIETINKIDYLTYVTSGNSTMRIESSKYISNTNAQDTLVNSYQYLDWADDGYVNRGVINGFYKSRTYPYSDEYEVTDLFDIKINKENLTDIDHVVTVLPKTEVDPGEYYVYVHYSDMRYGVGYLNNGILSDGSYSADEVVITPSSYPENWNRNIHMSSIRYLDPEYDIDLDVPRLSNSSSEEHRIFYNVDSEINYEITPKFIYDYDHISYKLQYTTDSIPEDPDDNQYLDMTWHDADASKYTIEFGLLNADESVTPIDTADFKYDKDFNGQYVIRVKTKAGIRAAHYRLVLEYTNPNNGISLIRDVFKVFDLTDKYYGLVLDSDTSDELVFPHNYQVTKNAYLDGYFISNPGNIQMKVYYLRNGIREYLNQSGNNYTFNIDGEDVVFFNTITDRQNNPDGTIKYHVQFKNIANATFIGTYGVELTYQEPGFSEITTLIPLEVKEDEYYINLENEYPRATADELSFSKDLTTMFIDELLVEDIQFTFYLYNERTGLYEDVSSGSVEESQRHIRGYSFENISCENPTCTARVRFYLNKNKIDMKEHYLLVARYQTKEEEYEVTPFEEMFGWEVEEQQITSVFNYTDDNNQHHSETVDGFYKNLDDIQIKVKISNRIHENNINYSINQSCITDDVCDPTSDAYSDLFEVTNTTGTNQYITLVPKRDSNNKVRMATGKYALVLYYENSYYRIVEFDVHSEYAEFIYNNITEKSQFNNNGTMEEVDGIYASLPGEIRLDTTVKGIPYDRAERYVINAAGERVPQFTINLASDFATTHESVVTYNPSVARVSEGVYTYVTEYIAIDGDSIQETYQFSVYKDYFDFDIQNVTYNPDPVLVNRSGKITFNIQTKNISYLIADENGDSSNGRVNIFLNNSKMYDWEGNDVTNQFTIEAVKHQDTLVSGNFDIVVSFRGNTISPGPYKFETTYQMNMKTITKYYWVTIRSADRFLTIGEIDIESNTPDNMIHNSDGGSYKINYTSNTENVKDEIEVSIKSGDTDVTDKFDIEVTDDQIIVTYNVLEEDNLPEGDYGVHILFADLEDIVDVHLYGEYIAVPPLTSSTFDVTYGEDPIIYIKTTSSTSMRRNAFLVKLNNLQSGFKITDKNGNDITNNTILIGTGMKIENPGDNTYTVVFVGDINQDGNLSLADVAYLFQYVTGKTMINSGYQLKAADVRKQNNITLADVAKLFQFVTGKINSI